MNNNDLLSSTLLPKNNKFKLSKYIIGCILLIILDLLWLNFNHHDHTEMIEKIQKKEYKIRYAPYVVGYILLLLHFIILLRHNVTIFESLIHGFILFGIINCFYYAYFSDFEIWDGIKETLWGTFLITFVIIIINYMS